VACRDRSRAAGRNPKSESPVRAKSNRPRARNRGRTRSKRNEARDREWAGGDEPGRCFGGGGRQAPRPSLAGLGNDLRVVVIYHTRSLFLGRLRFKRREILAIGSGGQPPAMSVWRGAKSGMKMSRREITFEAVSASHGYLMWGAW
jgi:hypothetical protein